MGITVGASRRRSGARDRVGAGGLEDELRGLDGCETPTTCEAPAISTVRLAPARSAMSRCAPAGMLRSSSPKINQLGTERQRGWSPEGSKQRGLGDRALGDRPQRGLLRGQIGGELVVELIVGDVGVRCPVGERHALARLSERRPGSLREAASVAMLRMGWPRR